MSRKLKRIVTLAVLTAALGGWSIATMGKAAGALCFCSGGSCKTTTCAVTECKTGTSFTAITGTTVGEGVPGKVRTGLECGDLWDENMYGWDCWVLSTSCGGWSSGTGCTGQ